MSKKAKYILSRLFCTWVFALIASFPSIKEHAYAVAASIGVISVFVVIYGSICIRRTNIKKEQFVTRVMNEVDYLEKHEYWVKYFQTLQQLKEEFPQFESGALERQALEDRAYLEQKITYLKEIWQNEEVAPSVLDRDMSEWQERGNVLRKDFPNGFRIFIPTHVQILESLKNIALVCARNRELIITDIKDIKEIYGELQKIVEPVLDTYAQLVELSWDELGKAKTIEEYVSIKEKMMAILVKIQMLSKGVYALTRENVQYEEEFALYRGDMLCWLMIKVREMYKIEVSR